MSEAQRRKISKSRSNLTDAQRENMAAAQRGKKASEETKAKMSASRKGHEVSESARMAIGNAHRGKSVSEETRLKISASKSNPNQETRLNLSRAKSGENHPCYGKHLSEETRSKISAATMGKPKTRNACIKMSESKKGIIPPNIEILKVSRVGSTNSDYQKERVSEAITGLTRSEESKELNRIAHIGVFPSEETRKKISENRTGLYCGEENHSWKGGTSFFPYCNKFNNLRKVAVRNFFDNKCICCGKHKSENMIMDGVRKQYIPIELSVHHIHHNKNEGCNGVPFNLVPLCHACHNKELAREEEYKKYINATLESGFSNGIWSRTDYERLVMYPE